jgi:hypothetical protein
MNCRLPRLYRLSVLLLAIRTVAFATVWEINVNTDMTDEGKKLAHPSADHPAYYFPYCVGYQESGTVAAGIKKLSPDVPITRYLAEALAAQGYLVTHAVGTKLDPSPSLLLIFRWGYINPHIYDSEYEQEDGTIITIPEHNERAYRKEQGLLGIKDSDLIGDTQAKIDLSGSAEENRYFVTIAAYDFATYYTKHKAVLLWVSRMSIPRQDLELDQVVAPLIKTGTPFLGRETTEPKVINIDAPPGNVTVGPTEVKGVVAPAQPPAATTPTAPPKP